MVQIIGLSAAALVLLGGSWWLVANHPNRLARVGAPAQGEGQRARWENVNRVTMAATQCLLLLALVAGAVESGNWRPALWIAAVVVAFTVLGWTWKFPHSLPAGSTRRPQSDWLWPATIFAFLIVVEILIFLV